jgi:sensor histidine kinase regulating citrate/malate metabolism
MPDDVRNTIKKAYAILNVQMEDYMQNGKINPVSGIFLMKNNMQYEDKSEVVITPNTPLGAEASENELAKHITDGVIIDGEGTVTD